MARPDSNRSRFAKIVPGAFHASRSSLLRTRRDDWYQVWYQSLVSGLGLGRYTFEVRAFNSAGAGPVAKRNFKL
jgi:hypothetical protein